jgi:hypothetical protein
LKSQTDIGHIVANGALDCRTGVDVTGTDLQHRALTPLSRVNGKLTHGDFQKTVAHTTYTAREFATDLCAHFLGVDGSMLAIGG